MARTPVEKNKNAIQNTPLFTGKEPSMLLNTIANVIPGGQHASGIIGREYERMLGKDMPDTYLQDLAQLPQAFGRDIVDRTKQIPSFLFGSIATPALTISEGFGGPSSQDFGPLGQQSSYLEQRQQLQNAGAGEVYSDVMPALKWLLSIAGVKKGVETAPKIADTIQKSVKNYQNMPKSIREGGYISTIKEPLKGEKLDITAYRGEGRETFASHLDAMGSQGTYYSVDPEFAKFFGVVTKSPLKFKNALLLNEQNRFNAMLQAHGAGYNDFTQWAKDQGFDGIFDQDTGYVIQIRN